MPHEIEAKFHLSAPEPFRRRLAELGGRPAGRVLEVNRILDTAGGRLLKADCGLRVRECRPLGGGADAPATALLTYKGPRQRAADFRPPGAAQAEACGSAEGALSGALKTREEVETLVADAAALVAVFERLGYHTAILYEKRRETWHLGPCAVTLDELPRLGWWVEIEGPDAVAVERVRAELGLAQTPIVPDTYVELAARHGAADADGCRRLVFGA